MSTQSRFFPCHIPLIFFPKTRSDGLRGLIVTLLGLIRMGEEGDGEVVVGMGNSGEKGMGGKQGSGSKGFCWEAFPTPSLLV